MWLSLDEGTDDVEDDMPLENCSCTFNGNVTAKSQSVKEGDIPVMRRSVGHFDWFDRDSDARRVVVRHLDGGG